VLGGVAAAATASLGTSSSREDGIDAMLLLCECELGEVGVVGDMGGRDAGGGGDDAEGENQPRFGWGWAGMSWGVDGCGSGAGVVVGGGGEALTSADAV
jgi:hypothetical protein